MNVLFMIMVPKEKKVERHSTSVNDGLWLFGMSVSIGPSFYLAKETSIFRKVMFFCPYQHWI